MIHMKRSVSLPGPDYPSPPQSPNAFQSPTKTATPAPFDRSTRWLHTEGSFQPFRGRDPAVKQDAQPPSAGLDTEDAAQVVANSGSNVPHTLPLEDISQYASVSITDVTPETASTTLQELAHLIRLSTYQERRRSQSYLRLQRSLVSAALSARLARCGELAHRTLVDNFRADDKKSFANLYNAIHDVRNSCDASRRYALLEPDLDIGLSRHGHTQDGACSNFIDDLPSRSRETFLNFLLQIRTNQEFLASRISSLSPSEISALTLFHQGLEPVDSVLPFQTRSKGHTQTSNRNSPHVPTSVERLLSFQRHDPLSALIYICFANSAGPDSAEDLRRVDIWSTVCARLITDGRSGIDPFICSILNIWTAMRDWSGKTNMEWYLMKILEDGAFLLEKAEDQAGTRIHVEPRNAKDSMAAEGFYNTALQNLFEIIADQSVGGIPEGVLELGNAILRKLDPKKHTSTKRFLVSKWLFSVFLLNAIIHPEAYGMLSGYHITQYGRQKILREVALKAQRLVADWTWKQSAVIPTEIRVHIENIFGQFETTKASRVHPKLLPARSMTSLRETAEVRPYLVMSPSDLVTMVNALFPEKRLHSSAMEKDSHFTGTRSTASSVSGVSGISVPISMPPLSRSGFDTASVLSNSGSSSILSDITSREPVFDEDSIATNRFSSTSISSMSQAPRFEDEGYKLRLAIRDMSDTLGPEIVSGSCHPCAEQWAVLFITSEGKDLSTQITEDDENASHDDTSNSDSEFELQHAGLVLDEDYPLLRDSILKLVEEFEVPQSLGIESKFESFSNKTAHLSSSKKNHHEHNKASPHAFKTKPEHDEGHDALADRPMRSVTMSSAHYQTSSRTNRSIPQEPIQEQSSLLLDMLEAAEIQCKAQSDFMSAHLYWNASQQLQQLSSRSLTENGFVLLLNILSRGPRDSIRRSARAIEEYDAWMVWLKQSQERHDTMTETMMQRLKALRDKMWYVTDVRNSAPYESARNVAVALKSMAAPKNNRGGPRPRNISRSSMNNFLLKTETQVLDILAASDEHGGPNKLSDEQSDKTVKWLSDFGIENFCKGEERIHRFCLEIETCINKLVGDSLTEGPVLWSSELFQRDKRILESGRQKGDLVSTGLGTLSISSDNGTDTEMGRRRLRSVDLTATASSPQRDLRSLAAMNGSQQSFDSSRWSMARSSISGDFFDSPDYFGPASPVLTIDSGATFWSPFQTRVLSPSTASYRSRSKTMTTNTVVASNLDTSGSEAKYNFLSELKESLLSLLLSDLGTLVFAKGSETDSWFSGKLGQDSIEWRERQDKKLKKKLRVIEKKKSFQDLRLAQKMDFAAEQNADIIESGDQENDKATPFGEATNSEQPLSPDTSSTSDTTRASSPRKQSSKSAPVRFPFKDAFKKLLTMFSVHPNPYIKLNALLEIVHLIVASLTSKSPRRGKSSIRDAFRASPKSPAYVAYPGFEDIGTNTEQTKPLDDAIDNCNKRRSQFIYQNEYSPRSTSFNPTSTDLIVDVLQDLFRESGIRPKTLFRDLQFIAAFVPASILDKTDRGKAFWDAGLAALGLKQDMCCTLIEIANDIVLHYTQSRQASTSSSSSVLQPTTHSVADITRYTMQDAARMWTITAKEGDAVAERELAIFYLTHPELVERTTSPLTRPRDTFKPTVMEMHAAGGEGDRERNDPATMCVAYHWMELSALGGDELAKKYLLQRAELNALP